MDCPAPVTSNLPVCRDAAPLVSREGGPKLIGDFGKVVLLIARGRRIWARKGRSRSDLTLSWPSKDEKCRGMDVSGVPGVAGWQD